MIQMVTHVNERRKTMVTGEGSSESSGQIIAHCAMRSQFMPIGRRSR